MTTATTAITAPASPRVGDAFIDLLPPQTPGGKPVQAIVKIGRNGMLRSVKANMRLDPRKKHTWGIGGMEDGQWVTRQALTAVGYDYLNQVAGVIFVSPDIVMGDDGRDRPNPCIERDDRGEVTCVRIRKIGLGRNATGNLVAQDLTVNFDLQTYLRQDLWAKWSGKKKNATPKDWGFLLPSGQEPTAEQRTNAVLAPFPMPGNLTLWVNIQNNEARSVIGEHINRQKFAERLADTICRRNIMKRFIPVTILGDDMTVPVVGWMQDDRDMAEIGRMVARAKEGSVIVDDDAIEVQRATEVASDKDDVDAAIGGEVDQDMQSADDGPAEEAPPSVAPSKPSATPADPEVVTLRADIRMLAATIGDATDDILGAAGIEGLDEVARLSDKALLTDAYQALRQHYNENKPDEKPANNGKQGELIPATDSNSNFVDQQ